LRQAPQLPKRSAEPLLHPFLLFLLTVSVLATAVTLYLTRPEYEGSVKTMQSLIQAKTELASANEGYGMVVEESGPGYNLRFSGQVAQGLIYGKMDAYDLEIFTDQSVYYVRGSGVYEEWEEMGSAQLDGLSVLIRDPLDLLQTLLSGGQVLVEEGPQRMVEDIPCVTYFLEIPPPDLQMLTRFEEEATLDKLQLYLWFDREGEFLHRMALLLNITVNAENIQINRIYSLSPTSRDMPDDLPQLPQGFISI
jgi:hypothetical protein